MARPGRSVGSSSHQQLRQAISCYLPHRGLPLLAGDRRLRWTDRLLVIVAVLLMFDAAGGLAERFTTARRAAIGMYATRRRPGHSYQGFIAALLQRSARLLAMVTAALRQAVMQQALSKSDWRSGRWICFGCDSTKHDCPRTLKNEQHFGCASKKGSWPQQVLTVLFHLGSGLPWCFVRGVARSSERKHLLQMLHLLPQGPDVLLLADAGFTGYDLLSAIMGSGRQLLIRVGANVRLLTKLGYAVREHEGIVYLWPHEKQGRDRKGRLPADLRQAAEKAHPPLVLRLIKLTDGRNRQICLLSSVVDGEQLSDSDAGELYRLRWKVEVNFRTLKQTLGRRKLAGDSPAVCEVELDWAVMGLWLLGLMSRAAVPRGRLPSFAQALRAVRQALGGRGRLSLHEAVQDQYHRKSAKRSRQWPHKKRCRPPGVPKARMATEPEIALAMQIKPHLAAA